MTRRRKPDCSWVDVTFIDGEVKNYFITASPSISQFLAKQAAETGILVLFNDETSSNIPLAQIREYAIRPEFEEAAEEVKEGMPA